MIEYVFFLNLCLFLSHDIFGFVVERSQESGIEADVLIGLLRKALLMAVVDEDGMPSDKWMEIYNSEATYWEKINPDRSRNRSNSKMSAYQNFRSHYHKKDNTS